MLKMDILKNEVELSTAISDIINISSVFSFFTSRFLAALSVVVFVS